MISRGKTVAWRGTSVDGKACVARARSAAIRSFDRASAPFYPAILSGWHKRCYCASNRMIRISSRRIKPFDHDPSSHIGSDYYFRLVLGVRGSKFYIVALGLSSTRRYNVLRRPRASTSYPSLEEGPSSAPVTHHLTRSTSHQSAKYAPCAP